MEYPKCGGGILRQHARLRRERDAPSTGGSDGEGAPVALPLQVLSMGLPRFRLGVACAPLSAPELLAGGASDGARWRPSGCGSTTHSVPRCAVNRSVRHPSWKALVLPCCSSGRVRPRPALARTASACSRIIRPGASPPALAGRRCVGLCRSCRRRWRAQFLGPTRGSLQSRCPSNFS